ncbi:MAG: GGDEF domain-containing protein [Candidatus Moraniibacteriota bacterium]
MINETYKQGEAVATTLLTLLDGSTQREGEFRRKYAIQSEQMANLHVLAFQDPLTGLLNRRGFGMALHRQTSILQRYTHAHKSEFYPPHIVFLDLDNFKIINDIYGHLRGDQALLKVTAILREVFHRDETEAICRWGGDEFIVLLSSSTQEEAVGRAELLRKRIESEEELRFSQENFITASIGVTMVNIRQDTKPDEMDLLFHIAKESADRALYHSKQLGRNTVTLAVGDNFRIV